MPKVAGASATLLVQGILKARLLLQLRNGASSVSSRSHTLHGYCLHPSMHGGAPVLLGQRTRPAIAFLHDLEMITLVIGIYLDCLRVSDFFPLRTVRTDRRYDDRESYLGNV